MSARAVSYLGESSLQLTYFPEQQMKLRHHKLVIRNFERVMCLIVPRISFSVELFILAESVPCFVGGIHEGLSLRNPIEKSLEITCSRVWFRLGR